MGQTTSKDEEKKEPSLRFQIASDIHVEFYEHVRKDPASLVEPAAPILALLGDIGCPAGERGYQAYTRFLLKMADKFEHVLIITGNHEYYKPNEIPDPAAVTVPKVNIKIREFCDQHPKLHFLDCDSFVLNNVRFVGATLWTNVPKEHRPLIESTMNDYKMCLMPDEKDPTGQATRPLNIEDTSRFHLEHLDFIQREAQTAKELGQKCVVLTHHAPLPKNTSEPQLFGRPVNTAFSTDLGDMLNYDGFFASYPAIHTWCFGHTHFCTDFYYRGVHIVANQRGYPHEHGDGFRTDCVLEV